MYKHIHIHSHMHVHTYMYVCTHTHAPIYVDCTYYTNTCTHTHTHLYTHTLTHVRTHTHSLSLSHAMGFTLLPPPPPSTYVGEWENSCNELQRMLIVRSMRSDRVPFCVTTFIINNLGSKSVTLSHYQHQQPYIHSTQHTCVRHSVLCMHGLWEAIMNPFLKDPATIVGADG